MNSNSNTPKNQIGNRGGRIGRRGNNRKKNDVLALCPEREAALKQKAEEISKGRQSFTWRELESTGKSSRNEKLTFMAVKYFDGRVCDPHIDLALHILERDGIIVSVKPTSVRITPQPIAHGKLGCWIIVNVMFFFARTGRQARLGLPVG